MTAEKLFFDWLNKQDYWIKALYKQINDCREVTDDALKAIIDCYVQKKFDSITFTVADENTHGITLSKIYDIHGVNRLIANQEIVFGKNLTVVYGENGTGKTGYSRIIQQVGKYIGESQPIKPNVFEREITPKAKIDYSLFDGENKTLEWNNNSKPKLNIKLFNSACVHFSLNNERKIDFTPRVFYSCEQLASATLKLSALVNKRLKEFSDNAISPIIEDTKISNLVKKVLSSYDLNDLLILDKEIETLNIDELTVQKIKLQEDAEKLSISALTAEQKRLLALKQTTNQIINLIEQSDFYIKRHFVLFKENQTKIKELQSRSDMDSLISQLHIQEELKQPFTQFIKEADKLYRLTEKDGRDITSMQKCLLCGQPIGQDDDATKELLRLYGNLIYASQFEAIEKLLAQNHKIEENCAKLVQSLETLLRVTDINSNTILAPIVKKLLTLLSDFKDSAFETDIKQQLNNLKNYSDSIAIDIEKISQSISANDEQRKAINITLNEISAQIDILKNWEQERAYLLSYINLSKIKGINNHGIANCQKDIQEKIYKTSFMAILQSTLSELNAPSEVKFNTAISNSRMAIKQGYNTITKENQLSEILSEGEQTVVALAQFIAESKFDVDENVLFFDDPVNSLDLKRMQVIANNLVALAKEKQIVIFTHNLVFLGFIKTAIDHDKALSDYKFYQTEITEQNGKQYVGKITEHDNPNVETYSHYSKEINNIIKRSEKETIDLKEIKHAYGCIRSAIELLVCDKILKGTTERYKPDISIIRFSKINLDALKEDQEPLTELYENVCRYIDGHSSSPYAKIDPNITTLKSDFTILTSIAKKYN